MKWWMRMAVGGVGIWCACSGLGSDEGYGEFHVPRADGVRVVVELSRNEVWLDEPLLVEIRIRNERGEGIGLYRSKPEVSFLRLRREGQKFEEWRPDQWEETYRAEGQNLGPGEEFRERRWVLCQWDRRVGRCQRAMPEAGRYWVKAGVSSTHGVAESEAVGFETEEPEGWEREVWQKLPLEEYRALVQLGRVDREGAAEELGNIAREHPGSRYSQYIAMALGKFYASEQYHVGASGEAEKVRGEHRRKAEEYFGLAAKLQQVPWVREQALLELAKLKGGADATRICDEALSNFHDSSLRNEFTKLRAAWQKELEREAARPIDAIGRVERELTELGYDLSRLNDEQKHAINYDIIRATWDDCEERKLSNDDCDAELIRRYKAWAVQNLKPTLPPKTNETSAVTAPVEP
ncbi:MAG: hypothetical protein NZ483_05910 [Verrucomicrobiae bacterium]|nr:hypothetical protein [Verrucomicrobiae bacterium]